MSNSQLSPSQKELNDRKIGIPHGRVLGGCSALNAQAFLAPSKVGFDLWRDLGNLGWEWDVMRGYFDKCYSTSLPTEDIQKHLRLEYVKDDKKGPLQTSYPDTKDDRIMKAWIETFKTLDYHVVDDPFDGASTGAFVHPSTVDGKTKSRSSSATAYYLPVQSRPNLHLMTGAHVEKIIFNTSSDLAIAEAVQFAKDDKVMIVKATKEVILTAGAIHSPKILELSGIGESSLLQSHCIEVVVENPNVGENFHDHPMGGISFEVVDDIETLDSLNRQDPEAIKAAMTAYQVSKTGPFSAAAINSFALTPVHEFQSREGQALAKKVLDTYQPKALDVEYEFLRKVYESSELSSACYLLYAAHGNWGAESHAAKAVTFSEGETGKFITIAAELSYPLSRGSIHINSPSPSENPTIDPAYFKHPLDLEILARHVQFMETLVTTEPLLSILKPGGKRSPEFAAKVGESLEDAKEYVRKIAMSGWHPVGTCAMLPRDNGGVVNERLKVYGTGNLRVADASVMPVICRGNTQSTVYAVAEKASDLIKDDWKV